ncbi:MAG: efflux RND transporter periplasmic adaptor subunit, partial [Candidatus Aminicenantes bacterium]|nr:efflux RND transporter periplasmic adaptor subunit [Candidatus Aminicenantes bacterium]
DQAGSEGQSDPHQMGQQSDKRSPDHGSSQKREGQKPEADSREGSKPEADTEDIDVDKLDIPDRMKEAIKSGQIPKERVREMLARMGQGGPGGGGPAALVNVEPVERQSLNSYLVLNGIVEPERTVEIFSRLSAYVKQIVKEEGAFVRENDVLALLDDKEIRISYQQARIQLEQAKLSLEEAEANLNRSQELIKKDLISEQEFQTTEATYKQRQLDYENRQESFKDLELQLNWTRIRSLSDGYITERLVEVGDRVNANQQVYTIEDFSPLLVRVFVPTSDSIKLKTDMLTEITTEIIEGTIFRGRVKLINPRVDVQSGTVKVTVEVFDETLMLKPGMFVEAKIVIGKKEDVLIIPRKSILFKQNKTYVFVMDRNQVSQREIVLGLTEEDHVEILSGLEQGEVIVTVGVEGLKDGERVEVVR